MKEHDNITDLFKRLEGSFDTHETPSGHQRRFLDKLNTTKPQQKSSARMLYKVLTVAATITLLVFLGGTTWSQQAPQEAELASVSAEMEQTQSFFTTTINTEIQNLKSYESPETKKIIDDALVEIQDLETAYQQLKKDLVRSGNNKRVIHAMIANFQDRITLLEQVAQTIEEIKTFKNNIDETIL